MNAPRVTTEGNYLLCTVLLVHHIDQEEVVWKLPHDERLNSLMDRKEIRIRKRKP